jgi:hypothetical protein
MNLKTESWSAELVPFNIKYILLFAKNDKYKAKEATY